MAGFTIVLVDSDVPEDGDFVWSRSFGTLDDVLIQAWVDEGWPHQLMRAARKVALRDARPDEYVMVCVEGAEVERFFPDEFPDAAKKANLLKKDDPDALVTIVL